MKHTSRRHCVQHVVRRQRSPYPLQLELTDRLDLNGVLDFGQHAGADEDLSRLGLVAKARGDIRNGTDSGVVEPVLEADCAERSEAVRYADAEAISCPRRLRVGVKAPMASRTSGAMSTAGTTGSPLAPDD